MSRPKPLWKPPARQGVGASAVALPAGPWPTVLDCLIWRLPQVSAAQWRARMAAGEVLDEQGQPVPPDAAHRPGARLWYWRTLDQEAEIPFQAELLFRDEFLVAVDKPHFLPVTPSGRFVRQTVLARLQQELGLDTLVPIHRLDRETAGVVLLCIQPQTRARYQALFRERQVRKVYEAVAPWRPELSWPQRRSSRLAPSAHFMQMHEVDGEPNAETDIELLERQGDAALYRLHPHTGQTHQLRVHMQALGLPLYGDRIYPVLQPLPAEGEPPDYRHPLQLLAREIRFTDPVTGQVRCFSSQRRLEWPPSGPRA